METKTFYHLKKIKKLGCKMFLYTETLSVHASKRTRSWHSTVNIYFLSRDIIIQVYCNSLHDVLMGQEKCQSIVSHGCNSLQEVGRVLENGHVSLYPGCKSLQKVGTVPENFKDSINPCCNSLKEVGMVRKRSRHR